MLLKQVQLSVSTADPSFKVNPPVLEPFNIGFKRELRASGLMGGLEKAVDMSYSAPPPSRSVQRKAKIQMNIKTATLSREKKAVKKPEMNVYKTTTETGATR